MTHIDVAANLREVKSRMVDILEEHGVCAAPPRLIAVSKRQSVEKIRQALEAGHRLFGENRVQEAAEKWPALKKAFPDVKLHLIGQLQSNKAEDAVAIFDAIETIDRPKLAHKIAEAMEKLGRRPDLFIQVNTGDEPQKGGVALGDLESLVALCRDKLSLPLVGLMCIPPVDDDPALHFALLKTLARRHGLEKCSMGMSADYDIAAAIGADYVRVGTAIFGARD